MVNGNGYPTRPRDRNVAQVSKTSGQIKIDGSHRFVKADNNIDQHQRKQFLESVAARLKRLTPATRRVLNATIKAMVLEHVPEKRYVFRQYVNRAAIARRLGRQALVPYDIRMLHRLCDLRLIEEGKHPLPRRQLGDIWLGAGAEYVYTIPIDLLYCLLYLDVQERPRIAALAQRAPFASTGAPTPYSRPQNAQNAALRTRVPRLPKRSLLDRFFDWIGI